MKSSSFPEFSKYNSRGKSSKVFSSRWIQMLEQKRLCLQCNCCSDHVRRLDSSSWSKWRTKSTANLIAIMEHVSVIMPDCFFRSNVVLTFNCRTSWATGFLPWFQMLKTCLMHDPRRSRAGWTASTNFDHGRRVLYSSVFWTIITWPVTRACIYRGTTSW